MTKNVYTSRSQARHKFRNARRWHPVGWYPFLCTAGLFIVMFALRFAMQSVLKDDLALLFFSLASIVIAYYFGAEYALGLFAVSVPVAFYFFKSPYYAFDSMQRSDWVIIGGSTATVVVASILLELLQRERYSAALLQRVSDTRYQLLIEADKTRRAELAQRHVESTDSSAGAEAE